MPKVLMCLLILAVALRATGADELSIAREALRDGLWDVARTHAGADGSDEAKLIVLESLAAEGRWDDVRKTLDGYKDARGAGFDYYRAVVRGDHAAAMKVLSDGGSAEGLVEARLHEAEELARSGDRNGAVAIWQEIASSSNSSERALSVACANLMDPVRLRAVYGRVASVRLRRMVGLRLGIALLQDAKTVEEGERIIRSIVRDAPDADGARGAFLGLADARLSAGRWKDAVSAYGEAVEIWPDLAKSAAVQDGRGWALQNMGRRAEALEAFHQAVAFATDDAAGAAALLKEGDVLLELGRSDEAQAKYREVVERYPKTTIAAKLKSVVRIREMEANGRNLYREFRFADAMKVFGNVAEADSSRRQRMAFLTVLCLYGQGRDDEAAKRAGELVASCPDPVVRREAMVWLAKFLYNRREWKESERLFVSAADVAPDPGPAAESLLWAARAAFAASDFDQAIQLTTRLTEACPGSALKPAALLVQGEALIELARFDEAVLVLERVSVSDAARPEEKIRAQMLKADALYAMGADNPARYAAALESYRAIGFAGGLTPSEQLVMAFKVARSLEKLKRMDEAVDQYYTQVVLAYRDGRSRNGHYDDEARAAFSRAAFRLADEYEGRGRDEQAVNVLRLLAEADVPASEEARKRMDRISNKGRFL